MSVSEAPLVHHRANQRLSHTVRQLNGVALEFRCPDDNVLELVASMFKPGCPPAPRNRFAFDIEAHATACNDSPPEGTRLFGSGEITAYEQADGCILIKDKHGSFALIDIPSLHAKLSLTTAAVRDTRVLFDVLLKPVLILLFRACGAYSVHAASVLTGEHSLLFVGEQGVGKSTICTMAVHAGHATLSDDQHLLRMTSEGQAEALGLPSGFKMDPSIASYLPELGFLNGVRPHYDGPKRNFTIDAVYPGSLRQRCVPTHLIFLSPPSSANSSSVRSLSKADALCRLIRSSQMVLLDIGSSNAHLHVLTELVKQCECAQTSLGRDVYHKPSQVLDLCVSAAA